MTVTVGMKLCDQLSKAIDPRSYQQSTKCAVRTFLFSYFCELQRTKCFQRCFIEQRIVYTKEDETKFQRFYTQVPKELIRLYTHFIFNWKLGTLHKPAPSEDQQVKVHAIYSTFVSVLWFPGSLWLQTISVCFPTSFYRIYQWKGSKHARPHSKWSERLHERSRENYLFVYVHSFLRPRILTFLLCNAATVYKKLTATNLVLLTVSV